MPTQKRKTVSKTTLPLEKTGNVVLRPTRKKYKLTELVSRITPKNRHKETDWGEAQGKEHL